MRSALTSKIGPAGSQNFESNRSLRSISFSKAMNTIPIRPLLTLKLATLAALAFALLLMNGCHWVGVRGNGKITSESRSVENFSRVEADGAFTITWTSGSPSFHLTTDSNLMDYVRTRVSGETLHIEWVKPLQGTRGIKIDLATPALSRVTLNGAVRFTGTSMSGREFYLEANGASRISLQGKVDAMSGELNGASRLDAESLETHAMELSISGAGRAEVNVTEALRVDISGAGKVIYSGNPTISKNISGAGSVRKKD